MVKCFNKNTAEYRALQSVYNDDIIIDSLIRKWQESKKVDQLPSVYDVQEFEDQLNTSFNIKKENFENSIYNNLYDKKYISKYNEKWYVKRSDKNYMQYGIDKRLIENNKNAITNYFINNNIPLESLTFKRTETSYEVIIDRTVFTPQDIITEDKAKNFTHTTQILSFMKKLFPNFGYDIVSATEAEEYFNTLYTKETVDFKKVNSYYFAGRSKIIRSRITPEIAIEEMLHPFVDAIKLNKPALYKGLLSESIKNFPALQEQIIATYSTEKGFTKEDQDIELTTQALARHFKKEYEGTPSKQWYDKIASLLKFLGDVIEKMYTALTGRKLKLSINDIKSNSTLTDIAKILNTRSLEFSFKPFENVKARTIRYSLTPERQNFWKEYIKKYNPVQQDYATKLFGASVESEIEFKRFTANKLSGVGGPQVIFDAANHKYRSITNPNDTFPSTTFLINGIMAKEKLVRKEDTIESIAKEVNADMEDLRLLNEERNVNWDTLRNNKGDKRLKTIFVPQEDNTESIELGNDFDFLAERILLMEEWNDSLADEMSVMNAEQAEQAFYDLRGVINTLRFPDTSDISNQALIIPQAVIANPDLKNKIAGQIDLLRIRADGTMDVIDIKTSKTSIRNTNVTKTNKALGIKYKYDEAYSVWPGSVLYDSSKTIQSQTEKLSKRQRHSLQVHTYGRILENMGFKVNNDALSHVTVHFKVDMNAKGEFIGNFEYEGTVNHKAVNEDVLNKIIRSNVNLDGQEIVNDVLEENEFDDLDIEEYLNSDEMEGMFDDDSDNEYKNINQIYILEGLRSFSGTILGQKEMMKKFKGKHKLLKSNQEIVDQIDNVATLIAGLTSQPQEGEKTPFAAYEEILDIYIEELDDFIEYAEDPENIQKGLEYIGRIMNMAKYIETFEHLSAVAEESEELPSSISDKIRRLQKRLSKIQGTRVGNVVKKEGLITKSIMDFGREYVGEGGKGRSKRNFSKEELDRMMEWATDIGLSELLTGDMNTSRDTILALMAKEYKEAKIKSLDEMQSIMEQNNSLADDVVQAYQRAGGSLTLDGEIKDRNFWSYVWQMDSNNQPTGRVQQKISQRYYDKKQKLKEDLIDPVTDQRMEYVKIGENLDDMTDEEIKWNRDLAAKKKALNEFNNPESVDEDGEVIDGKYHRYTDYFKTERAKYMEPFILYDKNKDSYYVIWEQKDNVSDQEFRKFQIKHYNSSSYKKSLRDSFGEPTGEVVEEFDGRFVKSEFIEINDQAELDGKDIKSDKWNEIMDADPNDELATAKKNYFEYWIAQYERLKDLLPYDVRQNLSGGKMPIMRDNFANQVIKAPNSITYLWAKIKDNPFNPWGSFWKPTIASRVVLQDEQGNPLDTLPVYYTGNMKNDKAIDTLLKKRDEIKEKLKKKEISKKEAKEQIENIDIAIDRHQNAPMSHEINLNAPDVLNKFTQMAVHYDAMTQIEDLLQALIKVVEKREYEPSLEQRIYRWTKGKFVRGGIKGDDPKNTPRMVKMAYKWMNMVYYNNDRKSTHWGVKIAHGIMNLSSMTYVGFNPWGNINNYAIGRLNNMIETGGALYYCRKCAVNATIEFNKTAYTDMFQRLSHSGAIGFGVKNKYSKQNPYSKAGAAIEHFYMLDASADIREQLGSGGETLGSYMRDKLSWGYFLQDQGEFNVQSKVGIAILMSHKMRRGPKENNDVISLWEALQYNHKTGKMTMKEGYDTFIEYGTGKEEKYTDRTRYNIRNYIREVNKQIHGNYAHDDRMIMQSTAIGELLAQFHKWVMPAMRARFRTEYFDENLGWIEGRYMTLWTFMAHVFWNKVNIEKSYKNRANEFWQDTEKGRMRRANVLRTATDVSLMVASLMMAQILDSLFDDEDEDKSIVRQRFENALIYQFHRQATELKLFIPIFGQKELWMMAKSPIAASRYLGEWADVINTGFFTPLAYLTKSEEDFLADKRYVYQTGDRKGKLKFNKEWRDIVPIIYAFQRFKMYDNMKDFYVK